MTKTIISLAVLIVVSMCPAKAGILKKQVNHSKAMTKTIIWKPVKAMGVWVKKFAHDPMGATWDATKTAGRKTYNGACFISKKSEPLLPGAQLTAAGAQAIISVKAAGGRF